MVKIIKYNTKYYYMFYKLEKEKCEGKFRVFGYSNNESIKIGEYLDESIADEIIRDIACNQFNKIVEVPINDNEYYENNSIQISNRRKLFGK